MSLFLSHSSISSRPSSAPPILWPNCWELESLVALIFPMQYTSKLLANSQKLGSTVDVYLVKSWTGMIWDWRVRVCGRTRCSFIGVFGDASTTRTMRPRPYFGLLNRPHLRKDWKTVLPCWTPHLRPGAVCLWWDDDPCQTKASHRDISSPGLQKRYQRTEWERSVSGSLYYEDRKFDLGDEASWIVSWD